jgi:hypothetical protein
MLIAGVLLASTFVLLGGLLAFSRWADPDLGVCPGEGRYVRAFDMQLEPGLEEHQSWLDFPAPQGQAPRVLFLLCVDDRVIEVGIRGSVEDRYRVNVKTRWVDWQWLRGSLAAYQDIGRWRLLLFLCEPADNLGLSCA